MNPHAIADVFERIGTLLEYEGENPFKIKAYRSAARVMHGFPFSLDTENVRATVLGIDGIGDALSKKIIEFVETGHLEYLERLEARIPAGVRELLLIPGLGPKKTRRIVEELGIASVGELEYACRENRLARLKGFGLKSQEALLEGIRLVLRSRGRLRIDTAMERAEHALRVFGEEGFDGRVLITGDIRRCMETVDSIECVACIEGTEIEKLAGALSRITALEKSLARDAASLTTSYPDGMRIMVHVTANDRMPLVMARSTGSTGHVEELERHAMDRGLERIFDVSRSGGFQDERDVHSALGLQWIPPELRENRGEIVAAMENSLPSLVTREDIKGIFHVHTRWSDGADSIRDISLAAKKMGHTYIGIADHSESAFYAGGLDADAVRRQWDEIDRLNGEELGIRIFKGIECDIRPDGSLDYDDVLLEGFDFVIASVHSKLRMTADEATARLVLASAHPSVTMIGHPTGRLLLAREGYPLDMGALLDSCARNGTMVELNADPHRLDLDWRHLRDAAGRGVMVSINPDAHSIRGLNNVDYGVMIARKGWLEPGNIFNTRSCDEVAVWLGLSSGKRRKYLFPDK